MIRRLKQYFAVRSYMKRLSQQLVRRFGKRPYYSVGQVTQAAERGKFSTTFIAYAHAAFCNQKDFEVYYQPTGFACSYQGLRTLIGQRFLHGQLDFDASTIISRFRPVGRQGDFYESRQGEDYPTHPN